MTALSFSISAVVFLGPLLILAHLMMGALQQMGEQAHEINLRPLTWEQRQVRASRRWFWRLVVLGLLLEAVLLLVGWIVLRAVGVI